MPFSMYLLNVFSCEKALIANRQRRKEVM